MKAATNGELGVPVESAFSATAAEQVCRVVSNIWVNERYKHLVLAAPPFALTVRPGQFFHLLCPSAETHNPFFRRPMSVYEVKPEAGLIEFLYKVLGAGTRAMAALEAGGSFDVFGPLGNVFTLAPGWRRIVMLARGVGLATLAPLAGMARDQGIAVTAILSAQTPDLLMSVDLLGEVGAEVVTVTDSEGTSDVDRVEALIRALIEDDGVDAFFTCGSNRLLLLVQRLAAEYGIPGQVALEQQMACGLGMCLCCVRPFRTQNGTRNLRVCWEGPVFDIQEAISW